MAEILNLNRARKQRDKAARQSEAAENRVRFGRRKAEKDRARSEAALVEDRLSAHRLAERAHGGDKGGDAE